MSIEPSDAKQITYEEGDEPRRPQHRSCRTWRVNVRAFRLSHPLVGVIS